MARPRCPANEKMAPHDTAEAVSACRLRGKSRPVRPFSSASWIRTSASRKSKSVALPLSAVTKERVRAAHRRGLIVHVYTVNAPHDLASLCAMGVAGIFTDYPDRPARIAACHRPPDH
ncbi:glycerophosphodiester phosphodiesterase [Caldibacillus thermoamylovorans]